MDSGPRCQAIRARHPNEDGNLIEGWLAKQNRWLKKKWFWSVRFKHIFAVGRTLFEQPMSLLSSKGEF